MRYFTVVAILLLMCGAVSAQSSAECVPCKAEQQPLFDIAQTGIMPSYDTIWSLTLGQSRSLSQLARQYTLHPGNVQPEDQLQLTWSCYYRFTGPTKCIGHTWYGYFCLSGSWYCTVFGTCKWIPIGSC